MSYTIQSALTARATYIAKCEQSLSETQSSLAYCTRRLGWLEREMSSDPPALRRIRLAREIAEWQRSVATDQAIVRYWELALQAGKEAPLAPIHIQSSHDFAFGWADFVHVLPEGDKVVIVKHSVGSGDAGIGVSPWSTWTRDDGLKASPIAYSDCAESWGHPARKHMPQYPI